MSIYSEKLKRAFDSLGLKQQDVAFDLRIDPGLLSKVLNGTRTPPKGFSEKIASYPLLKDRINIDLLKHWEAVDEYNKILAESGISPPIRVRRLLISPNPLLKTIEAQLDQIGSSWEELAINLNTTPRDLIIDLDGASGKVDEDTMFNISEFVQLPYTELVGKELLNNYDKEEIFAALNTFPEEDIEKALQKRFGPDFKLRRANL